MFHSSEKSIIILIVCVMLLVALLSTLVITIIYKYQQRQMKYYKEIDDLKTEHQNTLLQSQLEIQEQTFQHIAREVHDNIGQKLTLAKLYLNTISYADIKKLEISVSDSLELITESIKGLSDISRSMSTELILNNGLVKGIETEVLNLKKTRLYNVDFNITGTEIFLSGNTELVIFRIVQEGINNFLKHACGNSLSITLHYSHDVLELCIADNGKGFDAGSRKEGAGIININKRTTMLNGHCDIQSTEKGTSITIKIPINENNRQAKPDIGR